MGLNKKTVDDINVKGKRVLVRCDFNVPLKDGVITDETRIVAALPTIKKLINDGGKVILCSHLGKVKNGPNEGESLAPVAVRLSEKLGKEVKFVADYNVTGEAATKAVAEMKDGDVVLLQNTRFRKEETKNLEPFSSELASLADVFVMDAFGSAHRAHCSTVGVTDHIKDTAVGYLMQKEIDYLGNAVETPVRPFVAILGGAKVSSKISVIENLLEKVDTLIIGGGMAYTFSKAMGGNVGTSLLEEDYCQYVNPFIGNADNGHTFPGACAPFGLIQASPESGVGSWRYCSGYNYEDNFIEGFAQTHLNGTGCPDLGDILLFPFSGDIKDNTYKSEYDKSTQKASPGYYAVTLSDYGVDAEITATAHTALHRYKFNNEGPARLLVDLQRGIVGSKDALKTHVLEAELEMPDNQTITGHNQTRAWVTRHYFYVIKFDHPYTVKEELPVEKGEKAKRLILEFDTKPGEAVQVKVAMSSVSVDGALASLQKENPAWDFDAVHQSTRGQWQALLSRAQVTGTTDEKTSFYTSMYHLMMQPNNIADIDGRYRGIDDNIHTSPTGEYYSTFSLWDTYRAAHPLYTILNPDKVDAMIQTMLDHQKIQGFLPIWALWGKENFCMIGNHAIPVIVDAYLKGFKGFDAEEAYQAVKASATVSHFNSDWETFEKYGYFPFDIIDTESVSKTLECAYDDYCVAQMAKALGKTEDYERFSKRAAFYKNLFDPELKLMRGKDSKGNWRTPFNSFLLSHASSSGGDFTEGNSWQYTWHVQHDVQGLIDLMGGNEAFVTKLDSLFFLESTAENTGFVSDVTGLIGQYAHGNEPSHHVAYLYSYAGHPEKTQQVIREVFDRFYLAKPDGLCGNDDCGQMSAWYIFSAMGFYPVNPISGEYVLGAPQIEKISLSLPEGKTFTVEAKGLSKTNKYVKSVELNGKPVTGLTISHKDVMNGGNLVFTMTDQPGR